MELDNFKISLSQMIEIAVPNMSDNLVLKDIALWDSLSVVSTMGLIAQHFDMNVTVEALSECATLGDIFQLVQGGKQ